MKENKNHWYDGFFYDFFIAPNQDKSFRQVKHLIEDNSTVIDSGCGTGRFAFSVEDKVGKIDGVDLSEKNIKVANNKLAKNYSDKIKFYHSDAAEFLQSKNEKYDYALMSYVIHEVDESERVKLLKALADKSKQVILVDYLFPRPTNYWSWLNEVVEFLAGKEHYRNFKSYLQNGGIKGLAEKSGLKIANEIQNIPSTSHIVVLEREEI